MAVVYIYSLEANGLSLEDGLDNEIGTLRVLEKEP